MAKEKFLTVFVPIRDGDCESGTYTVGTLPAASANNINKIYKMTDGTYRRSWFNPASGQSGAYEYAVVVNREFPYLGQPMYIYDFTFDATRMGTAPTISAQGVMRYAEKDNGEDVTLDALWLDYWQECFVVFDGKKLFLKQIPTSSKNNEDARYKYDMDFVDEDIVLEGVYFYDIVSPFITEKPISEQSTFPFFGDTHALAERINASLIRSRLAWLILKNGVSADDVLTYEEWNAVGMGTYTGDKPTSKVEHGQTISFYYYYNGNYNLYLHGEIYESDDNGEYIVSGYQVKFGNDKYGNPVTSEEKQIEFQDNTIYEALQEFHDTFELQYYVEKVKNDKGVYTGDTTIWVADCEHDFADWDENADDYVRDNDDIPTTENPFDYGVDDALLSKEKTNTTEKIVTRITGVGSADNIPWYYPNPNPDGWIKPTLKTKGVEPTPSVDISYPTEEGSTPADNVRFEKYQKNRIGNDFTYGLKKVVTDELEYTNRQIYFSQRGTHNDWVLRIDYEVNNGSVSALTEEPDDWATNYFNYYYLDDNDGLYYKLRAATEFIANEYYSITAIAATSKVTFNLDVTTANSNFTHFVVKRVYNGTVLETYDSSQTYDNPTPFQEMCANHDGFDYVVYPYNFDAYGAYKIQVEYYVSSVPTAAAYDYEGFHYNSESFTHTFSNTSQQGVTHYYRLAGQGAYNWTESLTVTMYVGENFYPKYNLQTFFTYEDNIVQQMGQAVYHEITITETGRSEDGTVAKKVNNVTRTKDKYYKDYTSGHIYLCTRSENATWNGGALTAFTENPPMLAQEWLISFVSMGLNLYDAGSWYLKQKAVQLADYGMVLDPNYIPDIFDTIEFSRLKYITPQPNLMPEVYVKTDGERRFYNAHNYLPLQQGTEADLDKPIGEELGDDGMGRDVIINNIYKENETDPNNKHYEFENEYMQSHPHEHIENFDDVKPSIEGQTFNNIRIDVAEAFDYDEYDNDEIWENNDNGSVQGEYKHPYFFIKLRPMGFNLFDLALQEDMVLSMTTGNCGACEFKIGVDEKTGKNPVQLWLYDVYSDENLTTKVYNAGDLKRYVNTEGLYYSVNGEAVPVQKDYDNTISGGFLVGTANLYQRYDYSGADVQNGLVGTMKKDGACHFEGDVVTNGPFIDSQQDTSTNYVWIALMKDTDTYGTIMPSARPNYADPNFNVYIRPKSVADVQTADDADKFVLLNIKMPQVYLRRAERVLSRKLVEYMYDNNYQKFNFSLKFSRIFLKENDEIDDLLNENSVLYVKYNQGIYRQYVKHYTYRMSHEEALPEISVDMNEELSVSRTFRQQEKVAQRRSNSLMSARLNALAAGIQGRVDKTKMDKSSDVVMAGNIIIDGKGTSLRELVGGGSGGSGGSGGTVTQTVQWEYF